MIYQGFEGNVFSNIDVVDLTSQTPDPDLQPFSDLVIRAFETGGAAGRCERW